MTLLAVHSEIFGLSNGKLKHDYQSGGRADWLSKVHAINLVEVTPAEVTGIELSFLARAGPDATALPTAWISVNAIFRRARSLFSPRKLRHLALTLPSRCLSEKQPSTPVNYRSEGRATHDGTNKSNSGVDIGSYFFGQ